MKKIFIFISFVLLSLDSVFGSFEDIGRDAKAKGMGNAYYAEPGGVSSIYYNPAGTSFTRNLEFIGSLGMPYTGLETVTFDSFNAAVVFPFTRHFKYDYIFKNAAIGMAMNDLSFFYEGSEYFDDDQIDYYERIITFNLSKHYNNFFISDVKFGIGINFDILLHGFVPNVYSDKNSSYFVSGTDAAGFGMDVGFMYFFTDEIRIGLVLDNLIEPDVAFNEEITKDAVNKSRKVGASWNTKKLWKLEYFTVAGGFAFEELKSKTWEYHFGTETWMWERKFGARLGYELSDRGMNNLTMGLSGRRFYGGNNEFEINYAFIMPLGTISSTYGSHDFSLIYRYHLPNSLFDFNPKVPGL